MDRPRAPPPHPGKDPQGGRCQGPAVVAQALVSARMSSCRMVTSPAILVRFAGSVYPPPPLFGPDL
jgi:hypothetical protein